MTTRRNKFGNKPTIIDNIRFDSKKEAARYLELKILLHEGLISDLQPHPVFLLVVDKDSFDGKRHLIARYKADFSYLEKGHLVVEDVKVEATKTRSYKDKAAWVYALYGIKVVEV